MVGLGKLKQLGEKAQNHALRLKVQGLSVESITEEINSKYKSNLTTGETKYFLNTKKQKIFNELKEDKKYNDKIIKEYWNTVDQLKEINQKVYDLFLKLAKDDEYVSKQVFCPDCDHKFNVQLKSHDAFLKTAQVLLAQSKHADSILGNLQTGNMSITYNFTDLSKRMIQVLPNIMNTAQRVGIIKNYNKKRMHAYLNED